MSLELEILMIVMIRLWFSVKTLCGLYGREARMFQ